MKMTYRKKPVVDANTKPKFYAFNQNNSGGGFDFDAECGISHWVIVEAHSAEQANSIAESIGIYFNGCDDGSDCPCCGDRWSSQWSDDKGFDFPSYYGDKPLRDKWENSSGYGIKWIEGPEAFVHYLDGTIEAFEH